MRISWNWLKTLADLDGITPQEAADVLTSTGLEVEHVDVVEPVKGMLAGVVVGQVLECAKHPDADRLSDTPPRVFVKFAVRVILDDNLVRSGDRFVEQAFEPDSVPLLRFER